MNEDVGDSEENYDEKEDWNDEEECTIYVFFYGRRLKQLVFILG